jgi:RNA polymerase sigma-70 factor (ECF subfamily)
MVTCEDADAPIACVDDATPEVPQDASDESGASSIVADANSQMNTWRDEIVASVPSLRRFAAVLVPRRPHDQEELVQDTILRALDNLASNPPVKNTRAWLMSIMHNLNVNNVRKSIFRNRVKGLLALAMERVSPPVQDSNLELRELRNALMHLPPAQREVLVLVCVEGLKYQEVAGIMNIPVGTVMSRLARARQSLREKSDEVIS